MNRRPISIAGANTLLGQHLLARLAASKNFQVVSLHDEISLQGIDSISDSPDWNVCPGMSEMYRQVPLLAPDAAARAPLLASFLPDRYAEDIESRHLARGTQVVTHAEYARLKAPLVTPSSLKDLNHQSPHIATPNCTTVMCALPLQALHAIYPISAATITTLQAISGTDLPGMHAHAIHDQVVGHLPGEAEALRNELGKIFANTFPISTFATRVPVWRGHTLTMSLNLQEPVALKQVVEALRSNPDIHVISPADKSPLGRPFFHPDAATVTVSALRTHPASCSGNRNDSSEQTGSTLQMTLTGDNLEGATTGLMQAILEQLL